MSLLIWYCSFYLYQLIVTLLLVQPFGLPRKQPFQYWDSCQYGLLNRMARIVVTTPGLWIICAHSNIGVPWLHPCTIRQHLCDASSALGLQTINMQVQLFFHISSCICPFFVGTEVHRTPEQLHICVLKSRRIARVITPRIKLRVSCCCTCTCMYLWVFCVCSWPNFIHYCRSCSQILWVTSSHII